MSKVFDKMLKKGTSRVKSKGLDQMLLAQYLWPEFSSDAVHHDAYKCKAFGRRGGVMRPFPTQRLSGKSRTCRYNIPIKTYRVTHLLANLGLVDFDFGCSTLCLMGNWQNWLSTWARWWNIPNQSQPNPGSPGDGPPCISTWTV